MHAPLPPGAYGIILLQGPDQLTIHTEDFELAAIGKDFSAADAVPEAPED
jgi:hypothetical protein